MRGGTCIGSHRLYEFLHDNALFEFRPIEYVADPEVVVRNYKMASLTQAFAIDLTGQVCADQFHGEFYGVPPLSPTFTAGRQITRGQANRLPLIDDRRRRGIPPQSRLKSRAVSKGERNSLCRRLFGA